MFFKSLLKSNSGWNARAVLACALAFLALLVTGACTVTSASSGTGTLVVDWTIASSSDATQCSAHGAQNISIQLLDSTGAQTSSATTTCAALSATISNVPVGTYTIKAELLDVSGAQIASLPSPIAATITDSLTTTQTVDFPASSFTTQVAGTGSLVVNWTIDGTASASLCTSHAAQTMSIQVFDSTGVQYGATTSALCSALSATITGISAGAYTIKAELLDINGAAVTTVVGPLPVTVPNGASALQAIDFPETSFTGATVNPSLGSLTVNFTIAGGVDPTQCTINGAANIQLQLLDSNNLPVGTAQLAACSAFTATMPNLTPGTFSLTAKLVNASGADVTTTATVPGIVITAATTTTQPVDFPTTSFLASAAGTGSIAVTWTIASGVDPASCTAHNASSISLQLYSGTGVVMGAAIFDPCSSFSATITNLTPGAYELSAELVNASSVAVTTMIPPQMVTVAANASATQAFDFPANSFN